MKNKLLLLLLAFIFNNAVGQSAISKDLILIVERKPFISKTSSGLILKFKPDKLLRIKTVDGRKIVSSNYILLDNTILMNRKSRNEAAETDTISLKDIAFIKGKVYDDFGRKIGGGIIVIGYLPLGAFSAHVVALFGGSAFMGALPFIGLAAVGLSSMGARRFNTTNMWKLKIIEK
jgi:hypothetical protein